MPHDKNGTKVEVGNKVTVECIVQTVSVGEDYCNLGLSTVEPMYPGEYKTTLSLNAKQVVKTSEV